MNDTPTTNARWEKLCCSGQSWYQIAEEMKLDCRQKERELTRVTEQRDGLRSGIDYASDQLTTVTEQREEARQLAQYYRNLSCETQDEADETLLPWETTNPNEL